MNAITERISIAFNLTYDLITMLTPEQLKLKIPNVPSNTIGEQIWCIIGARQSYIESIKNDGEWQGFKCSLNDVHNKDEILKLLQNTKKEFENIRLTNNEKIIHRFLELLEHEVQHHGQLIRFFYSNKLEFPKSWNKRYTV